MPVVEFFTIGLYFSVFYAHILVNKDLIVLPALILYQDNALIEPTFDHIILYKIGTFFAELAMSRRWSALLRQTGTWRGKATGHVRVKTFYGVTFKNREFESWLGALFRRENNVKMKRCLNWVCWHVNQIQAFCNEILNSN